MSTLSCYINDWYLFFVFFVCFGLLAGIMSSEEELVTGMQNLVREETPGREICACMCVCVC